MNKYLSVLAAGLIAGSLSVSAFAADAAKPVVVPSASTATTSKEAVNKAATHKVAAKKDTSLKASVKKLFAPSAKKADVKTK
jgi:hypothetical protein